MDANLLELLAQMERQRSDRCSFDSSPAIHICSNPECSAVLCRKHVLASSELQCPDCYKAMLRKREEHLSVPVVVEASEVTP